MPLVDLSMVEQRYDAVREVLDGATVKDTATRYGIDRRTLHRWLRRYANEGLGALADKSSRPDHCPHQMAPEIEARIVEMRRAHQGWGPRTILNKLRRELEVIDGDVEVDEEPVPRKKVVGRRVDHAGRISILKHRYHVGRHLAGEAVTIESADGLLHITHNGVVVATHARRHLVDDDDKMDRRAQHARRPAQPTKGSEVLRIVDKHGSVSFAGTNYRVGNPHRGQTVGIRLVGDTVQISLDGALLRTHRARHDKTKEFGALAQPKGKPRRARL